jgi:site-specific DNA-methyltransferase (adenine-specific)
MFAGNEEGSTTSLGRWPSNVMLDATTAAIVDEQNGDADDIGPSRFFYVAKASKRDRNEGLEGLEEKRESDRVKDDGVGGDNPRNRSNNTKTNFHPTVKPTDLMRQLVRLVTPPGGVVLDPFTGSGSTGKAAILEGFEFIGVELTDEYLPIIEGRLSHAVTQRAQAQSDAVTAEAEILF